MPTDFHASQVFVPGGMPRHTYVRRDDGKRESRLEEIKEGSCCKLVCLSGPTKSGKTVLANRIFPRSADSSVWIDGGSVRCEDDLWRQIMQSLDGFDVLEVSRQDESTHGTQGGLEAALRVPLLASGKGKVDVSSSRKSNVTQKKTLELSLALAALDVLKKSQRPLIIDDFHYLAPDVQVTVARTLKSLIFEGHLVIIIAIPPRRHDVIRREPEFTGRVEMIQIPPWSEDELREIGEMGFPLLNAQVSPQVCRKLAAEAQGSPHLMQELCRNLCRYKQIRHNKFEVRAVFTLGDRDMWDFVEVPVMHIVNEAPDEVFVEVATDIAKPIFEKLARGPQKLGQRKLWQVKSGRTVDVYTLLLAALAKLAPGRERVDLEALRHTFKLLLDVPPPKSADVVRAIENLVQIGRQVDCSVPVIDWDEEDKQLFVTDPFFAFYLKWGVGAENQCL